MFGGVSTEVLWQRPNSRWALGVEANYVRQRAPDQRFGFALPQALYETDAGPRLGPSRYSVATGHVSAYYKITEEFHARIDVGRYLAGDYGATFALDREFANGWKVGAFATKTNVSARDFGSGSFDKGISVQVPLAWILGRPSRRSDRVVLRPFGRDGGARLNVDGRLYDRVRDYRAADIDPQFGGFWK